jgi:hypothetical protein
MTQLIRNKESSSKQLTYFEKWDLIRQFFTRNFSQEHGTKVIHALGATAMSLSAVKR